ncbi:MAG: tetratricopeptide repeat protein [bacterium]|nr:tetratricopeptide repeat protein [bacterium]
MSKLSQLKQDAYQAGKKRDWEQAVSLYEQILELDKSNPTLINELGDLCLKAGQTPRGVSHFLSAASKYRKTGLFNNAVAIYKKILRHDAKNINAHWFLAESRAIQGLLMEGANHALIFLENNEELSSDIKEIFLKRCVKLFELYPDHTEILDSLLKVFRMWNMTQESGRIQIQMGVLKWAAGEREPASKMVEEVINQIPGLANYPEYTRWQKRDGGVDNTAQATVDFDSMSFDTSAEEKVEDEVLEVIEIPEEPASVDPFADFSSETTSEATADPVAEKEVIIPVDSTPDPDPETIGGSPAAETDFGGINLDEPNELSIVQDKSIQDVSTPATPEPVDHDFEKSVPETDSQVDDSGCFNLDADSGTNFDDLIAQATSQVENQGETETEESSEAVPAGVDSFPTDFSTEPTEEKPKINLLDEILSDDSESSYQAPVKEVETISDEIGSQLGGESAEDDPASLYEMGMVYLEMGMHDKASDSFQKASCHPEFSVRAYEMWGISLLRNGQVEEAIAILTDGLDVPDEGSREYFGLLYHIARAHEQAHREDEALRLFEMINESESGFLDVGRRLAKLTLQS